MIHLVRHAHAGSRKAWEGSDADRPLSKKGQFQAEAIGRTLTVDFPVVFWASPTVRCQQTLLPLAEIMSTTIEDRGELAEGRPPEVALDLLLTRANQGASVVACTHGDLIPAMVAIAVSQGARLDGPGTLAKGARYRMAVERGRIVGIHHVPRPRPVGK